MQAWKTSKPFGIRGGTIAFDWIPRIGSRSLGACGHHRRSRRHVLHILFKQALDEKSFREGRRITLNEVSEETGISRLTLTRISNVPGYNTNTDTISALGDYFEIEPGELLKRV